MSDAVQDAIAAAEAEIQNPNPADGGDGDNKDGAAGAGDDKDPKGGSDAGQGDDNNDDGAGAGSGDDAGDDDGGGEELVLADVLEVEPAELSDEQKEFLFTNKDDLTVKQFNELTEAGVFDDYKPVEGQAAKVEADKPHTVPADDSDLVLEVTDANGKTIKISSITDMPEDFMYKDSRQPLEVAEGLADIREKKAERAKQREENDTIDSSNDNRNRVATLWSTEFDLMQADGTLPDGDIDWQNGKYGNSKLKDAAEGLFTFMTEENSRREKEGRPLIVSLRDTAVLKAQADAKKPNGGKAKTQAELDAEAKATAAKKEKARKIAGAQSDNGKDEEIDKPSYVRGSGQTIGDITEQMINETGKQA